jgi:hypothetical protein
MSNETIQGFANADADVAGVLNSLSNALVSVMHGAASGDHPLAGHTVGAARAALGQAYNVPSDASAQIGGSQVEDDYVLRPGESVQFVKQAGVKG